MFFIKRITRLGAFTRDSDSDRHNAKFGMENKKDPSNPASYANKGKDTDKILLLINDEFLSGEGFKAGRS